MASHNVLRGAALLFLLAVGGLSFAQPCAIPVQVLADLPAGMPVICEPRQACVELASCSASIPATSTLSMKQTTILASGENWLSGALVTDLGTSLANFLGLGLSELDGDGWREIITFSNMINIYNASSLTLLDSAPQSSGRIYPQGVVADIDLDGIVEIIAGVTTDLVVYNWTPQLGLVLRSGFPITVTSDEIRSLTVYDLEGDGKLEIIVSSTLAPSIAVYNGDGTLYQPTGTASWLSGPMSNPAWPRYNAGDANRNGQPQPPGGVGSGQNTGVYDLDGDGLAEITLSNANGFEVFHLDGYSINTAPTYNRAGRFYTHGQQYYRWPNITFDEQYWANNAFYPNTTAVEYNRFGQSPPSFVDIDGDLLPEIVFAADTAVDDATLIVKTQARQLQPYSFMPATLRGGRIASFGSPRSGTSVCTDGSCSYVYSPPGVVPVDINKDGRVELLWPGGDGFLYCTDLAGTPMWKYNISHGQAYVQVTEPVVADLDGDGALEVIVSSHTPPSSTNPWYVVLNYNGVLLYEVQMTAAASANGNGAGGVSVVDRNGNGVLSVLVSTYGGTVVYDLSSISVGVSSCAPWQFQRGGFLRRGQRDYEVFYPSPCTQATAPFSPDAIQGYDRVQIDLRLLNGAAPAMLIHSASTASFTVLGQAQALNYGFNFSLNGTTLVATLVPADPGVAANATTAPPATGLPVGIPITGYIFIDGDVQLLPNATLSIVVDVDGSGGYLNVSGCIDVAGSLNITVGQLPTAGQNVSFIESPCITYSGTATVAITVKGNSGCNAIQGKVGKVDDRRLGVLFSAGSGSCGGGGLSKGVIAGIVVGTIVAVAALTTGIVLLLKYLHKKRLRNNSARSSRRGWQVNA